MTSHKVVVVIPAHNAESTIVSSVRSVLDQTRPPDEVVVVLNSCTDQTEPRLREFCNSRKEVVSLCDEPTPGLVPALNRGIRHLVREHGLSEDLWVARQDADDIWELEKLEKQLKFLTENPGVDVLGTQIQSMDKDENPLSNGPSHPLSDREIKAALLNGHNAINHPSVVFRSTLLKWVGGYDDVFPMAEDLHLWLKLSMRATFANLPDRLVRYRQVHNPRYNPVSPQVAGFTYQVIWKNGLGKR